MKHLPENQCRRCGHVHDDVLQFVDPDGRWAVTTVECDCGHTWTLIHTAPVNLAHLRRWIARDCRPEEGPHAVVPSTPWHQYRLEGICPSLGSRAS